MKTLKLKAPGKVNLRLDVLGRRPDGYHDLRMLNSMVNVFDEIDIDIVDRGITVICEDDPQVPSGEDNIVYRAAKEIMAYSNKNVGVEIRIKKRIPSSAGMGGGSSNAASVILGLNQMLRINLSVEKLMKIGLRFGADIPFFLSGAAAAFATGIGENVAKIKKLPKMPMVIVTPNLSVATKAIYEKYQSNGNGRGKSEEEIPKEFTTKKAVIKFLNNDLESVTTKQFPIVSEIKELLVKYGAMAAQMTGSGPSVFGIFPDKDKADKAVKKLSSKVEEHQWKVFLAENM